MPQRWIYLSHSLDLSTPVYGNREGLKITHTSSMRSGDPANSMTLSFPNHIGTHIDCPKHFIDDGQAVDSYPASFWSFKAACLNCVKAPSDLVTPTDIDQALLLNRLESDLELLLIRTGFERHRGTSIYWEENPGISPDLGAWLKDRFPKIRGIGMDFISVSRWQDRPTGRLAHKNLLGLGLILIEDMSLKEIQGALREVVVLPLRVSDADGAPCTIIGRTDEV